MSIVSLTPNPLTFLPLYPRSATRAPPFTEEGTEEDPQGAHTSVVATPHPRLTLPRASVQMKAKITYHEARGGHRQGKVGDVPPSRGGKWSENPEVDPVSEPKPCAPRAVTRPDIILSYPFVAVGHGPEAQG